MVSSAKLPFTSFVESNCIQLLPFHPWVVILPALYPSSFSTSHSILPTTILLPSALKAVLIPKVTTLSAFGTDWSNNLLVNSSSGPPVRVLIKIGKPGLTLVKPEPSPLKLVATKLPSTSRLPTVLKFFVKVASLFTIKGLLNSVWGPAVNLLIKLLSEPIIDASSLEEL